MNGLPTGTVKTMWFYNPNTATWTGPYAQTSTSATTISYSQNYPSGGAWQAKVVTGTVSTGTRQSTVKNVTVNKVNQAAVTINSGTTTNQGGGYTATATGGSGTGALVWTLVSGSTAPGAAINASSGLVTTTGTGTVKFNVYRAANITYNQSATTATFTLTVNKPGQAAVTITSGATTNQGAGYTATATGGSGTGALVWALGTGSSAAGAAINSASGVVTTTGTGSVKFNVYRAGDVTYSQSATTADFTLTVGAAFPAISANAGEAVTISSAVLGANSDVAFTVYDEGTSPSLAINGGNAATIGESPSAINALVKPGKAYVITVTGTTCTDYWLNFTPPTGYSLLVDGVARNSIRVTLTPAQLPYSINHLIELRPESSYSGAPFGTFTGVQVDKAITWEVGLGSLRNGRSASRLIFREKDLSNDPVSRARLYYVAPGNYGEIDVKYTADRALRQLAVPQGFIDIVDDAAGGYWLKFYERYDANIEAPGGNPAADTALYIVHTEWGATPWKTIRVELTAQGQLKITEKDNSTN